MRWLCWAIFALTLSSCSRAFYREQADRDVYAATQERNHSSWVLPEIDITPPPASRLHDPYAADFPPMPPDDLAASEYMHMADGHHGWKHWWDHGTVDSVELSDWRSMLPLTDGKLVLAPDLIMQQAQLHSRSYRTELEQLYLTSLDLTLNRFEFATQWYAINRTDYTHIGTSSVPTETNTLSTNSDIGFTRNFAAGGQLLVNFANSFVWEFTGKSYVPSSNISMTFLQPLLKNFGRQVRMEALTQGERSLLYQVRTFARFRKEFYVNLAVTRYLALLQQLQFIRNEETNILRQEQNYARQQAQLLTGKVNPVEVDQALTTLLTARSRLIQARTNLENELDRFKVEIGLPPTLAASIDDQPLREFQFSDPKLDQLQLEFDELQLEFRKQFDKITLSQLEQWTQKLTQYHQQSTTFLNQIAIEAERWQSQEIKTNDEVEKARLIKYRDGLKSQLAQLKKELAEYPAALELYKQQSANLSMADRKRLFELRLRDMELTVGQLFVIQNQVRVYSLNLPAVAMQEEEAIRLAIESRLDLMNERARVVDIWRQVAIKANQLGAVFNLLANADIGTDPASNRVFDFSAIASRYRVGFQFEGPLNRQIERNNYRASLIQYHRARRAYMQRQDEVVRDLRITLRQLETDRQNFEITRRSFVAAARQVELVPLQLRLNKPVDPLSQLNALAQLLSAKNDLIANWFNFQRNRIQLLLDTEQLQLDADGIYRDGNRTSQPEPLQQSQPAVELAPRPPELFRTGMVSPQ